MYVCSLYAYTHDIHVLTGALLDRSNTASGDTKSLSVASGNVSIAVQSQLIAADSSGVVLSTGTHHSLSINLVKRSGKARRQLEETRGSSFIDSSTTSSLLASCDPSLPVAVRAMGMSTNPYSGNVTTPDDQLLSVFNGLNSTYTWSVRGATNGGVLLLQVSACGAPLSIDRLNEGESIEFSLSGDFATNRSAALSTSAADNASHVWTATATACGYYDVRANGWSTKGCTTLQSSTAALLKCSCNTLGTFGAITVYLKGLSPSAVTVGGAAGVGDLAGVVQYTMDVVMWNPALWAVAMLLIFFGIVIRM